MISHIDHIVLTTTDLERCVAFYRDALGMSFEAFGEGRLALKFGNQKINIHKRGKEFEPKAHIPAPGALDLCFIASIPLEDVITRLKAAGIAILQGPVPKTGATGPIRSVYVRDPDLNLIEISEPVI